MRTRIITLLSFLLITSLFIFAQEDVTTFLGIPVDGTKSEMRQKLINKGFTPTKTKEFDFLEGEFNGSKVHVYIGTNNNKVYRIMLADENTLDEANIRIRFNNLVNQFERNSRYSSPIENQRIPDNENISYEMNVHNKVYEAVFFQKPDDSKIDTVALKNNMLQAIYEKYSPDELENATEDIKTDMMITSLKVMEELLRKKTVWFRIEKHYNEYYIAMFYDNVYNQANGEDL
ncbi:MAG: hypothetical protein IKW83_04250 [Muribaculaceae bacterium]|nr:hypothetical protein [Muribaculaceae bacterium]